VWRLALPNILANLTIPLLGAVDTAVIGDLGAAEIGAVAVGATVFSFLYWGFSFLRMGTSGLAAQARGAGDRVELLATLARAGLLALAFGSALVVLQGPIARGALALIAPSEAVAALARDYLLIRIWGAPAALLNLVILGWLVGQQRMGTALALQLVINGTNMALDVALAKGLGMEVSGVALATLIAQAAGAAAGVWLVRRHARRLGLAWPWRAALDRARLIGVMSLNADIFVRTLCVITAVSMFTALGARFGDLVLAANGILMLLQAFLSFGLDGFAPAAQALVGAAIGARDRSALDAAVRTSIRLAALVAGAYALVYALLGPALIGLVTTVPEVREASAAYLPWAVASPLVSVWSYQLDGIFIGATRGRAMRNAMLVSFAVYLGALAGLVPLWANHGLWLAFLVFMVARAATLLAAYPALARAAGKKAQGKIRG
jgi:MATE family multidrug resistance protein